MTTATHSHSHSNAGQQHKRKPSPKRASSARDAIALLKSDHAEVKLLFSEFENASSSAQQKKLAQLICDALTTHTTIEEELLYPAACQALDDDSLVDEALVEHQSAKDLIAKINAGNPQDDQWQAMVKVLSEYIAHHVKEEEKELFPSLRHTSLDLKSLGEQLAQRKRELSHNTRADMTM